MIVLIYLFIDIIVMFQFTPDNVDKSSRSPAKVISDINKEMGLYHTEHPAMR